MVEDRSHSFVAVTVNDDTPTHTSPFLQLRADMPLIFIAVVVWKAIAVS